MKNILNSDRKYWNGLLTGIKKTENNDVLQRYTKELPFNVIMFGFDSLSRNAFIRKLPKTYKFMTKHLKTDILQGYNIVGDGTPQALIPVSIANCNINNYYDEIHVFFLNIRIDSDGFYGIGITRNT